MRFVSVFASTLIFAASALGQQTSTSLQNTAQSMSSDQTQTATADQPPEHPITQAQVHELLELTGANRLKDQMIHNTMTYLQKAFPPYMPKDVIDDLETSFAKMDVESLTVKEYQKHISTEDATQFIAFYKTPAGRRLVSALPVIAQDVQTGATKQASQITQEVIARHKDEILAAAAKYRQQQPDTPTITAPN
jgi:uncharacterized protein